MITIPETFISQITDSDDDKCMREIHFYIENNRLNATVLFRAQAALIFPKNIHFIGSLMDEVRSALMSVELGTLFYLSSVLVADSNKKSRATPLLCFLDKNTMLLEAH